MDESPPVPATKRVVPRPAKGMVERPRLADLLDHGTERPTRTADAEVAGGMFVKRARALRLLSPGLGER